MAVYVCICVWVRVVRAHASCAYISSTFVGMLASQPLLSNTSTVRTNSKYAERTKQKMFRLCISKWNYDLTAISNNRLQWSHSRIRFSWLGVLGVFGRCCCCSHSLLSFFPLFLTSSVTLFACVFFSVSYTNLDIISASYRYVRDSYCSPFLHTIVMEIRIISMMRATYLISLSVRTNEFKFSNRRIGASMTSYSW